MLMARYNATRKAPALARKQEQGLFKATETSAYWLFVFGAVGSKLVNSFLLQLTLGNARLLEERAATQLFQHTSAFEFLLEALQRTVNGFVVFDLNDNHIEG